MKSTGHVILLLIAGSVCELAKSEKQNLNTGISDNVSTVPPSLIAMDEAYITAVTMETNLVDGSDQILPSKEITIAPTESIHHQIIKQTMTGDVFFVSEIQSNHQNFNVHVKSLSNNWPQYSEKSSELFFDTQVSLHPVEREKLLSDIGTLQTSLTELKTETVRFSQSTQTDYFTAESAVRNTKEQSTFIELTFQKANSLESPSLQNTIFKWHETMSRDLSFQANDQIILSSFEYHTVPECSETYAISQITDQSEMLIVQSKSSQSHVISQITDQSEMLIVQSKSSQSHVISQIIDHSEIQLQSNVLGKISSSDTSKFYTELVVENTEKLFSSSPPKNRDGIFFNPGTDYSNIQKLSSVSINPTVSFSAESSEEFSSYFSITTTPLPPKYSIHFRLKFRGDCKIAITKLLPQFWETLIMILADKLFISPINIRPDNISCQPVVVYITVFNVTVSNIADTLEKLVHRGHFVLTLLYENRKVHYKAYFVEEVYYTNDRFDLFQVNNEQLNSIDIIIIIVSCCVCIVLILIGIVIGVKECYRRKHEQSFDLLDFPSVNLNLEDFSLARIPRPQTVYADDDSKLHVNHERNRWSHFEPLAIDDIHLRTEAHSDGLVVGLAYTNHGDREHHSTPTSPSYSRINEDICMMNRSQEDLYKHRSYLHGATNPVYDENIDPHDII